MALWGNNDNISATGAVTLDYATGIVVGAGTSFGLTGSIRVGDVIRFGVNVGTGTYFGDAVVVGIASTTQLSIGSTAGLSGVAIAATSFQASQLPKYTVLDSKYSEGPSGVNNSDVVGVSTNGTQSAQGSSFQVTHGGWVGVTTYVDQHGTLRVKTETLVAMSGIATGNTPAYP
jgi:hypothetical protein